MAIISLIGCVIMLAMTLLGLGCACCASDDWSTCCCLMLGAITLVAWAFFTSLMNILLCVYGWPYAFGEFSGRN